MEIFFSVLVLGIVALALTNEFYQQKLGVSPMPTMAKVRREMIAQIPAGITGTITEIGSGWGSIAFAAARAHPHCQVVGIESSVFPFMAASVRKFLSPPLPNLRFIRKNFFDTSLKESTVILCYLSNPIMALLRDKLKNELPLNATIISSTFFIPDWEPERVKDIEGRWNTRLFIYKKKGNAASCPN